MYTYRLILNNGGDENNFEEVIHGSYDSLKKAIIAGDNVGFRNADFFCVELWRANTKIGWYEKDYYGNVIWFKVT
jgi:hypothetical protein